MFKQKISAKRGIVNQGKTGRLDSLKRMLGGVGGHSAAVEEYTATKETTVFQTSLAQMEKDRAIALQYVIRAQTIN
jgi:hypothetical protein